MQLLVALLENTWYLSVAMAPFLLLGFFMAGLLHVFVPETLVSKHMGKPGFLSSLKSSLLGIPLPICSCGVLPIASSLRRSGAAKSPTVSFLVTTPVTGVDSILATYALLGWVFTLARLLLSFIVGLLAGLFVSLFEREESGSTFTAAPERGGRQEPLLSRLLGALHYAYVELPSTLAGSLLLGLLLGGGITTLLPQEFITRYLGSGVLGILISVAMAIPLYVCATGSIPIATAMLLQGFSPGAALAFLIAGPATNAVAVTTIKRVLGTKTLLIYLGTLFFGALAGGLLFDLLLLKGVIPLPAITRAVHAHGGVTLLGTLAGGVLLLGLAIPYLLSTLPCMKHYRKGAAVAKDLELVVSDMTCNHCKHNITKILSSLDGVEGVEIDLASHSVGMNLKGMVGAEQILQKLREGGYSPERKEEE